MQPLLLLVMLFQVTLPRIHVEAINNPNPPPDSNSYRVGVVGTPDEIQQKIIKAYPEFKDSFTFRRDRADYIFRFAGDNDNNTIWTLIRTDKAKDDEIIVKSQSGGKNFDKVIKDIVLALKADLEKRK